jgi:hypothetical protein
MKKCAQYGSLLYDPQLAGKTLADLYVSIRGDLGLTPSEKAQLIGQVKGMTGLANESTPLSSLMMRGLGGTVGWLISKYFGLGRAGQAAAAIVGVGLGRALDQQLNQPPPLYPGYRMLG